MKYLLLVHHSEAKFALIEKAEQKRMLAESVQLCNDIHTHGQYLSAAPLHSSAETTSVQVRDGKALITDGPFAETREQLGGYFLVDVNTREEAVEIATRIPGATLGFVEVRPVREVEGLPEI